MKTDYLNQFSRGFKLAGTPSARARLDDLKPGTAYQFELTRADNGAPAESGFFSTDRVIAKSQRGHVVDGTFTTLGIGGEWSDIEPTKGRYAYLYADFDGNVLHVLNDWHICEKRVAKWDYNKFEVCTWPDENPEQMLKWLIRVYGGGYASVDLNGRRADDWGQGASGHAVSPLVPEKEHSIYELSIRIAASHAAAGHGTPRECWSWEMEWLDPIRRSALPSMARKVLRKEPAEVGGSLFRKGGMKVRSDWRPKLESNDSGSGCHIEVRVKALTAEVEATWKKVKPVTLIGKVAPCPVPRAMDLPLERQSTSSWIRSATAQEATQRKSRLKPSQSAYVRPVRPAVDDRKRVHA